MHPDFIQLRSLEGELKLSQKKSNYGVTVSTRELVFHKPHVNYHIKLADIISITPFEAQTGRLFAHKNKREDRAEYISTTPDTDQYRLYVSAATVHNRSGLKTLGAMQFVFPLHKRLMEVIARYSGLNRIAE
ncbi:hypothetical protein [Paenibacillus sp. 1P07SE]|uniref:hypothetical protein n=1 Tax=Paenibacillus sp. 1P07SE TaxID=3132209 RepID=UPI0039A6E0F1